MDHHVTFTEADALRVFTEIKSIFEKSPRREDAIKNLMDRLFLSKTQAETLMHTSMADMGLLINIKGAPYIAIENPSKLAKRLEDVYNLEA